MSIIRKQILYTGNDISGITISFSSNDGFIGYQQEIDNLTQATSLDLVNLVVDIEKRKVKMFRPTTFRFTFENVNSFLGAGFTTNEITGQTSNMLNSFFILDYYDTYDSNTQTKIFTTYLTKIGILPEYVLYPNAPNQLYYWYVPISYLDIQTGSTVTGYVKFSFYNAKTGNVIPFYNYYNSLTSANLTPEKLYFKAELNVDNKTWKLVNGNTDLGLVDARQLSTSSAYNTRVDNTFATYGATKQVFPTGTTYSYKTNKYLTPTGNTTQQ